MLRFCISLVATLSLVGAASAEPIRWGFRAVDGSSGQVLAEKSGITETSFAIDLLPRPDLPSFAPPPPDFDLGIYEPSVTTTAEVTILDESTGQFDGTTIAWTIGETWEFNEDTGTWEPVATWEKPNPLPQEAPWMTIGDNEYRIYTDGGPMYLDVRAGVQTPEPTTLALAGMGLAGLMGMRLRRAK
jgi:hypothetical protein